MAATKWATDTNVAIAAGLTTTAPPAPLAKPTVSAMEKKWQLRELQRAAAHPHLWTLGTATVGVAGWGMDALFTATVSGSAGTLAGLGVAGTAAAVTGITRLAKRKTLGAHGRRFSVAGAVSTSWITLASLGGISWWQLALLATGDLVLGAGYWRALREERRALLGPVLQPEPAVEPAAQIEAPVHVPAEPDFTSRVITLWDAHVGGAGGPLEGSTLTAVRTTDIGIEGIVNLKPAKHTLASALGAVPQVRSGLHLAADDGEDNPGEEVLFDQPGHVGDQRLTANQLRVQIVEKSPVRHSPWFERPMFATDQPGVALIGLYADGHGHAPWVLYDHDGVWSGVIIAGTGGGKSSVMDVLAISARATGVLNTMFIDPQGGASSPIMRKNASILGLGQTQIVPSLLALEAMADHREAYLNAHGLSALVPGAPVGCPPGCACGGRIPPGLVAFIDECDQVFGAIGPDGKLLGERFGVLAKRIRKLGMGFICASQYSGLQVFGNSELLRSNVATKNLVAFRTTSNTSGRLIPGLPVDPSTLPRRPGYGVAAGEKTRTAPFRACFAPRRGKALPPGVTPPAYADDVITLYPEPQVHPIDAAAIRGKLADPEIAAAQAQADAMRKLAAIMGGHSLPAQPVATASGGGTSNGTGGIPKVPAAVIPLPRQELDRAALGEVERAVLAAMSDGHTRTGDIVAAYGEDNPTNRRKIQSALNDLATAGWATKGGHGVWLLTDAARNRVA